MTLSIVTHSLKDIMSLIHMLSNVQVLLGNIHAEGHVHPISKSKSNRNHNASKHSYDMYMHESLSHL